MASYSLDGLRSGLTDLLGTSGPGPEQSPFSAFNFEVQIRLSGKDASAQPFVHAAFAECDGLEVTMEPKVVRSGGEPGRQHRLPGPLSYGNLTLKRGMTRSSLQLWAWALGYATTRGMARRAQVTVEMHASQRGDPTCSFVLDDCLPVKLKAPPLNAREGVVAVEELQIAYSALTVRMGEPSSGGGLLDEVLSRLGVS